MVHLAYRLLGESTQLTLSPEDQAFLREGARGGEVHRDPFLLSFPSFPPLPTYI